MSSAKQRTKGAQKSTKSPQNNKGGGGRGKQRKKSGKENGKTNGQTEDSGNPYDRLKNLVVVERPDRKKFDALLRKLNDERKACESTIDLCSEKLNEQMPIKQMHQNNRVNARKNFNVIALEKKKVKQKAGDCSARIRRHRETQREKENKAKKVRSGLKADTEQKIEHEIRRIEHQLSTTSMTINKEKQLLKEIKQLKAQRGTAREYQKLRTDLESTRTPEDIVAIRAELREHEEKLNEIKGRENKAYELMRSFALLEKAVNDEIVELRNKRGSARARIQQINIEQGEAQREHRRQLRKHENSLHMKTNLERQCRTYDLYEEKRKRDAKYAEQRQQREAEQIERQKKHEEERKKSEEEARAKEEQRKKRREKKQLDEARQQKDSKVEDVREEEPVIIDPYHGKKVLCRSIIGYLNSKLPSDAQSSSKPQDASSSQSRLVERGGDAYVGLKATVAYKKDTSDVDGLFGGSQKKKKRRRKRKNKQGAKIAHSPDVFGWFDKLGLHPPLQVNQISPSIVEVEKQLKQFEAASDEYIKSQTETKPIAKGGDGAEATEVAATGDDADGGEEESKLDILPDGDDQTEAVAASDSTPEPKTNGVSDSPKNVENGDSDEKPTEENGATESDEDED